MSNEKDSGKQPAFPTDHVITDSFGNVEGIESKRWSGMTKREYFAAMAMQGYCANEMTNEKDYDIVAKMAISQADALLHQLNNQ